MAAWYPHVKWRHPKTREGASPEIAPPLGIMMFIPLAAMWLAISLGYSMGGSFNTSQQIGMAVFGGVFPIGIAYGVMTNRRWTRIAILLTMAGNTWLHATSPGLPLMEQLASSQLLDVLLITWAGLVIYLYGSKSSRAYYLLIAGRALPESLKSVDLSPPRVVVFLMARLAVLSEWILIVLALAIFGLLFFWDYMVSIL